MKSIYQYICEMSEIEGFRSEVLAEVERLGLTRWAKSCETKYTDYYEVLCYVFSATKSTKLIELYNKAERIEKTEKVSQIIRTFADEHNIKVHFDPKEEPESMATNDYAIFLAQEILKIC